MGAIAKGEAARRIDRSLSQADELQGRPSSQISGGRSGGSRQLNVEAFWCVEMGGDINPLFVDYPSCVCYKHLHGNNISRVAVFGLR